MMNDHAAQRTMKTIRFELNGEPVTAQVEPHHNVVELLQKMGLHGARESCGQGLCGCCTVLVDDVAVSGCLYFASQLDGARVDTIERTEREGELDGVQQAFAECGAFQCGFCTPGMLMLATWLVEPGTPVDDHELREVIASNLCRCTGYRNILRAVRAVLDDCQRHGGGA